VSKTDSTGTYGFKRNGAGVTDPVLSDGAATYTPGISERRGGNSKFLHSGMKNADAQSGASANVDSSRTYDAFGNLTGSVGTWSGPFGYAGGFGYQEDPDHGLRLLGHRYYDSSTGRFISKDPIGDGRNWTTYCSGDPTVSNFASGLSSVDKVGVAQALGPEGAKQWLNRIPPFIRWLARLGTKQGAKRGARRSAASATAVAAPVTVQQPIIVDVARRNGEHAMELGKRAHREILSHFRNVPGWRVERTLPSGRRPDLVNVSERVVVEIKPLGDLSKAMQQAQRYAEELSRVYGGEWRVELWPYIVKPTQQAPWSRSSW
jgi:RHS repeat-associated protein